MTSYAPTPMYTIDQGYAAATAQRLANRQAQQNMNTQNEADVDLPAILMGLAGQNGPQPPAPGQPSVPSSPNGAPAPAMPVQTAQMPPMGGGAPPNYNAGTSNSSGEFPQSPPGGGPDISRIPPQSPQPQQNNGNQAGGYDLPTLIGVIKQQYPNISGGALRNILATVNPFLLTPAARIQLQRLGISQENADTNRLRADTGVSNNNVRQIQNFGQQIVPTTAPLPTGGAPPQMPPMGGGASQGQQPQQGPQPFPGMSPDDMNAVNSLANTPTIQRATGTPPQARAPQNSQMGGGFGGVAPTAPIKGQNEEATMNAKTRNTNIASMQNDMQLYDNLGQLKTLLSNPNFGTGAAGDTRAQAAGVMYYLTGDPKWNDAATVAQLDQKAMAGILVDQVSNLAASGGSGSRSMATDLMKKYVAQMKPEVSKTPDANRSVIEGASATLERNTLMKQFFNDVTQTHGIYPQQAQQAVLRADSMYPLVTINPNGSLQVNKDNVGKFKEALSQVSGHDYTSFGFDKGGEEQSQPAPNPTGRTATDAKGNIYTETPDGQWLDKNGKAYGGK